VKETCFSRLSDKGVWISCKLIRIATSSKGVGLDELSGVQKDVDHVFCFVCGFECDTLSTLNRNRQVGENVIAQGEGKTGSSAQLAMKFIERARPFIVVMECVKGLGASAKPGDASAMKPSDLETLIDWANKLGYLLLHRLVDAASYGAACARGRYYLMGFRIPTEQKPFSQRAEGYIMPEWAEVLVRK